MTEKITCVGSGITGYPIARKLPAVGETIVDRS